MATLSLVTLAKQGNDDAFVAIVDESKQQLYQVAFAILRSESLAQDCIQSTILLAYRSIKKLRQVEYFDTWITRICINECNKEYRKHKNRVSLDSVPETGYSEDYPYVRDLINRLPHELNVIVSLKIFNDNTFLEIGEILGMPLSTVKSKYYKALDVLKVDMEEYRYE